MQRRATKNTRGPNADEKKFQALTKESNCVVCNSPGPSIVHHCMGATYKHNKQLIGHWFVLPLCQSCDDIVTHGSRRKFKNEFGLQGDFWKIHYANLVAQLGDICPDDIQLAIDQCNE